MLESDRIGTVYQVVAQIHFNPEIKDTTILPPPLLDWEEWCGPAPELDYRPSIGHLSWRLESSNIPGRLKCTARGHFFHNGNDAGKSYREFSNRSKE
jgi:hypothetical protein